MAQFVNMHKVELSNSVAPVVPLRQIFYGDVAANRIGAIVLMNGAPVTLGGTCSGTAILADGSTVALTGTVSGNEAYVVLPAGCYSIEGQIQVFVKLTVSGVTTTLLAAVGTVRLTETDQIIDPGTIIPSVAQLISDIENAVASIPADYSALLGSIAHTFSASTAYTAGKYVWYNGELYRFNVNHPAGAWIGTDAARYTATDEFPIIQQALGTKADAADVAELKSDLNTPINIGGQSVGSGQVIYNTGDIGTSSSLSHTDYIDLTGIERIVYTRFCSTSTTTNAGMAFYDSNKDFINDGQRAKLGQDAAHYELTELAVPENAVYARFTIFETLIGFAVYDYADYSQYIPVKIDNIENTVNNQGEEIDAINGMLLGDESVDFSLVATNGIIIASSSGKWSSASRGSRSYFIYVQDDEIGFTVTANENFSTVVALLKTDAHADSTYPDYATGGSRVVIPAGASQTFDLPDDCHYIYVMKSYGGDDYTPASASFKTIQIPSSGVKTIPLGLHEMPENENILNIVKRCRQLTDIKWTPVVDLPRYMLVQCGGAVIPGTANPQNYMGKFKAGVEYTGVPYGRVSGTVDDYGINYGTVGHYIGFDTFISSVSNPKSKLSKEDVSSISQHRSLIYATVCSGLTCYALNVGEVPTANIERIPGLTLVGKLNDNGTLLDDSIIKIGDVLNLSGYHTAIITDIIRDSNGIIVYVELSDASTAGLADRNYDDGQIGGICRRKGWTREQLFAEWAWGNYSVYRYSGVVPYTPSQYVNVGDEFDGWRIEHFPIMPYEGDGFVYKTGYIPDNAVKLVITLDGYSYVKAFKNGEEISGSPFSVTKDANDEINPISVTEIGEGDYTAYLCNISNGDVTSLTYACHWSIGS